MNQIIDADVATQFDKSQHGVVMQTTDIADRQARASQPAAQFRGADETVITVCALRQNSGYVLGTDDAKQKRRWCPVQG